MPDAPRPEAFAPWREGWHSARALARPGFVLQATALALVLAYYFLPAARLPFDRLAVWRAEGGLLFSALASVLCGGVIPVLYLQSNAATRAPRFWVQLAFFSVFWAWKGAEVDLWYRLLGVLLGNGHTPGTVAAKVLCDQFVFNPFYTTPVASLLFAWKDAGFRWAPVAADFRRDRWYARRVLPPLLAVWGLWIPVASCIFALPQALQVPLFNVVLCFWSMLYAHITRRQNLGGA